ncbi:MAG: hypothetical protein RL367_2612 [Pseudomonadota bacterium]
MFIGHWSASFVAATHPRAPRLGTLMVAAQLIDWGFFALMLTGTENMRLVPGISAMNPMDLYDMPYTHSLLGACAWGLALGLFVRLMMRDWTAAVIGFAVVVSHWWLDLLVHVPDLTIAGSPPKLGFGLWNHPAVEMPLEIALTVGGLWLYARNRGLHFLQPRLLTLLGILALVQAIDWFGPVATQVTASIPLTALFGYALVTGVAVWVDRGRAMV